MKSLKNILSLVIVIAMLAGCFTFTAFAAETVTISVEKAVPGYPVNVLVDGAAVTTETVTYYVAGEDGEYTQIDGASGDGWQITNDCAKKTIKAKVDGVESNAIAVGAGLTPEGTAIVSKVATEKQTQYAFRLSGSTENANVYYQVLDSETVNGKKQYLILRAGQSAASGNVGKTGTVKWEPDTDPSTNKTMAYWLEHYWYEGVSTPSDWKGAPTSGQPPINATNNATLDGTIKPYVVEHTWLTARNNKVVTNDYTFTAHATVMSSTEFREYADKLYIAANMMLRNGRKDVDDAFQYYNYKTMYFNKMGPTARTYYVFPIFYLTEDFFKNVKLDLDATGSDVRALILEHNNSDVDALAAIGYDETDLAELGVIPEVEAEGISLTNASGETIESGAITGTTSLTATYTIDNRTADTITGIKGVIAVFENGILSTVTLGDIDATSGEGTYPVTLTGLDTSKTYTARVMVWKGLGTLIPLGAAAEFSND